MQYEDLPALETIVQENLGPRLSKDEWIRMNVARARTNALREGRDPNQAAAEAMQDVPPVPQVQIEVQNGEQP